MNKFTSIIVIAYIASFTLSWREPPADQRVDRCIVYRAIGNGEFAILGTSIDTMMIDSTVTHYVAHRYGVTAQRDAPFEGESDMRCILTGRAIIVVRDDSLRLYAHAGRCVNGDSMLCVFYLPSAPWDVFAIDNTNEFASFGATCEFDYNHDGIVDLSDFSFFGERDPDAIAFEQFINMYGKQSRYFPTFRKVK